MNYSLKLFGLSLILVSAWIVGKGYSLYTKRRLSEMESFALLLDHIEKEITLFLSTPRKLLSDYLSPPIEAFLEEARSGGDLGEAFRKARSKLSLSEKFAQLLDRFFSEFGKSYRDGELKKIEICKKELLSELKTEEESSPGRIKLAYTLLFAAALSLVIMLL